MVVGFDKFASQRLAAFFDADVAQDLEEVYCSKFLALMTHRTRTAHARAFVRMCKQVDINCLANSVNPETLKCLWFNTFDNTTNYCVSMSLVYFTQVPAFHMICLFYNVHF